MTKSICRNVYQTILLKDTVARENIRNISFLEELVHYLADNVGNLRAIKDDCPKYVVTLNDIMTSADSTGIRHLNLVDFLSTPS